MYFVGDLFGGRVVGEAVEVDCGQTSMFGTEDVGVEVVANHEGGGWRGAGLAEGIVEEEGRGLVGSGIFTEDDVVEVGEEATGVELLVLHLVEAVAAQVHAVASGFEVIHQLFGSIDQPWLDRTEGEELVTDLAAVVGGGVESFAEAEGVAETLYDEVVALNFPLGILRPQADVGVPIVVVEDLRVGKIRFPVEVVEEFIQCNESIAMGVVEGVVEVDEKVCVVH